MARPSRAPRGVPAARGCRGAGAGLRAGPSAGSSSQRGVPGRAAPGLGALGLRRGAECPAHRRLRSRPGARGRARCALLPDGAGAPAAGLCFPPTRPAVEVARGGGARKRGAAPGPPPAPRPPAPWARRTSAGGSRGAGEAGAPQRQGGEGSRARRAGLPCAPTGTLRPGQGLSRETQRFRTSPASAEGWDPQGQWRNAGHLQKTLQLFSLQLLSLVLKCPRFSSALRESVNIKEGIRGVTGNSFISLDADAPHADAKMPTISCLLFVELPLIVEAAF
ncbi:collagen alpha-2(I) chain-like isoform X1 [Canis lupus familiaris]|uniref:collagen alpha-2(I) chain-like isoform X1 n=1 Tax=Canis lupus familiaris TaxID=9615 RepID=UPI0018F2AA8F|nr:collagen alpha-2(I) chain-like isoform X1 [Canis lupus familiaris]